MVLIAAFSALGQGPTIYPAAMSMEYNPLLWQGDDARFALEVLHSSRCKAEVSKAVAAQTQNVALQTLALRISSEQDKLYRQLRSMARTFNFHVPPRDELDCPGNSRIRELSGQEMNSDYLALLLKSAAEDTSRFQEEVTRPRLPSNWSLWKLAKDDLPMIRSEQAALTALEQHVANHN